VATQKGYLAVVKMLVEEGEVHLNTKTERGATALYMASSKGHTDIVAYLLEHGADHEIAFENGYTPLHAAVSCKQERVVELLLKHGASLLIKDMIDDTPLDTAIKGEHEGIIRLCVANWQL
jgi:ankyrin repeat protein